MPISNIFKKKKEKPEIKKTREKKHSISSSEILNSAHVTEKATDLTKKRQYVFNVSPGANKTEIKRAVEDVYGVDVESVRTIKVPGRERRLGRHKGWKSGYKKAIVKVAEGQEIEILPK